MPKRLVLASHNKKKAEELHAILAPLGIELLTLASFPDAPEPEETGTTFEENATIKALSALRFTGIPSVADDSGLVVDALGGAPGVYSSRFAGPDADDEANNILLLRRLADVPMEQRTARFVSVIAFARAGAEVELFRGETEGFILQASRGVSGFGYDPLFLSKDLDISFAEALPHAKNQVSHRARSLAQFMSFLGES